MRRAVFLDRDGAINEERGYLDRLDRLVRLLDEVLHQRGVGLARVPRAAARGAQDIHHADELEQRLAAAEEDGGEEEDDLAALERRLVAAQPPAEVLKAAREKKRIKPEDLAHKACLSKKHIIELEEGGVSSFYSEAHKVTVAKKIAKLLELDEARVLVHPDGDAIKQKDFVFDAPAEEVSTQAPELPDDVPPAPVQKTLPIQEKVNLENIKSGDSGKTQQAKIEAGKRAGAMALIVLVLVGLYITLRNTNPFSSNIVNPVFSRIYDNNILNQ